MNYLSGGKKSILGTRLSSRYLSSDAFTSSAGKTSGRSISRLGSLFGRKGTSRKFSGTGQQIGLFEFKNIVVKSIFVLTCLILIGYTMPFTRFAVHTFFVKHASGLAYPLSVTTYGTSTDSLLQGEHYVAPVFGSTDVFVSKEDGTVYTEGDYVYVGEERVLVGTITFASSSRPLVSLLSAVGQKHNLFLKNVSQTILDNTEDVSTSTTSSSTLSVESEKEKTDSFSTAVFEGFGYGQLRAQVPPQEEIPVDTTLYARTENGLVAAARVSYVEKDTGSTFTNIYAQLLVPPFQIYKVRIGDIY